MSNMIHSFIVFVITLLLLLYCLLGCSTKTCVSLEAIDSHAAGDVIDSIITQEKIINKAILKSGAVVTFNKDGGCHDLEKRIITGIARDGTKSGTPVTLSYDDVFAVQFKEHSSKKTRLLVIGAGLIITPILLTIILRIF